MWLIQVKATGENDQKLWYRYYPLYQTGKETTQTATNQYFYGE